MSFFGLLAILSLMIIMPIIFTIRSKKLNQNPPQQPDIQTINIQKLPNLFQQIICDIEAQFTQIVRKNQENLIISDSYIVAKQLFFVRLPQMLQDYLELEPNYAKNHVVDEKNGLTSYLILQQQLKAILNVFYQINQSTNHLHLQNILVNQRYLQSVVAQTGLPNTQLTEHIQSMQSISIHDSDYDTGLQYLLTYLPNSEQYFSRKLIQKIGEFFYFASITQIAVDEQLGKALAKMAVQSNLELENVSHFLNYQLPMILQNYIKTNSQDFEQKILISLDKMLEIFTQILTTLDTTLNTVDKLALLQNYHDDFSQFIIDNFSDF